jgi:molybdenum cofactor biosynthesis enzyme MoaA
MDLVSLRRPATYPSAPLFALDTLWFQVAGTICNLRCTHCFISCSPENHSHAMMSLGQVLALLDEAKELGVREYYFTGGEPLMNRDIFEMFEAALRQGPVSFLTNGVLIKEKTARRLRALSDGSEYSLDVRISIDGWDPDSNDPIRGGGTFERILAGIRCLAGEGLNPVITVTEACGDASTRAGRTQFLAFLRSIGLDKPRLKILPLIRLGAEESRVRGYHAHETLADVAITDDEAEALQCSRARMACASGVYVCPLLIDSPSAMMGRTLAETMRPFELRHQACYTCHVEGLKCTT